MSDRDIWSYNPDLFLYLKKNFIHSIQPFFVETIQDQVLLHERNHAFEILEITK